MSGRASPRRALIWGSAATYVAVAAFLAWQRLAAPPSPDFAVFWEAGARFASGAGLYPAGPVDHSFLYPPFAAWVFQPLASMSPPGATAVFHLLNLLLWPVMAGLTALILRELAPAWWRGPWPVVLAVALSLRFFLWNWVFVQTNELVITLILAGIWSFLRRRDVTAVLLVSAATFLKVVPGIFLVWLLFRGRRRTWAALVPSVLLFILLPMVWRGFPLGWQDLGDYHGQFLSHYLGGGVRVRYDNFNLATLVYSLFVPLDHPAGVGGPLLMGGAAAARTVYQVLAVIVGMGYLTSMALLRYRRQPLSPFEVSGTFLAALLLSGVTWNHHLVALLFVFATFFICPWRQLPGRWRSMVLAAYALIIVHGLAGRDTLGSKLHDLLAGYRTLSWSLVYLFVLCLALPWVTSAGGPGSDAGSRVPKPQSPNPAR